MKFLNFIKKEPVMVIALLLGLFGIIFVRPGVNVVISAIDFRVLAILFCLMIVIQAFQAVNLLDTIARSLLNLCGNLRTLYLIMTFLVFFISMLVTNDVALLTFVPITLVLCKKAKLPACFLIVLETLAANLGSCVTPMGNPQNLFLFSFYQMPTSEFFLATLKIAVPSIIFLAVIILIRVGKLQSQIDKVVLAENSVPQIKVDFRFILYICLFIISILTVFHVIDYRITFVATLIVIAICNYRLFAKVDYTLLITFVGFFIFTGCISALPSFADFLKSLLSDDIKTYLAGIITSQCISNVPAALLLSNFTTRGTILLLAVNVGGLGTLIASMASVISFKLYRNSEKTYEKGMPFFTLFSILNFSLLIILMFIVWVLQKGFTL